MAGGILLVFGCKTGYKFFVVFRWPTMIPHLVISGAPSTGKSYLIRALRERYPELEERCVFLLDGGRWWMERYQERTGKYLRIEELDLATRSQMQWEIYEYYLHGAQKAEAAGKTVVADAFFADVLAYSMDCLDTLQLAQIEARLEEYRPNMQAYLLPGVQLPLELDGLRHEDEAFREEAEKMILSTYKKYEISYTLATCMDIEDRVQTAAAMLGIQVPVNA